MPGVGPMNGSRHLDKKVAVMVILEDDTGCTSDDIIPNSDDIRPNCA